MIENNSLGMLLEELRNIRKYNMKLPGAFTNSDIYIKRVIYNAPATIVIWNDGTRTVSKCNEQDVYNCTIGLLLCIIKKLNPLNTHIEDVLKVWLPQPEVNQFKNVSYLNVEVPDPQTEVTLNEVRKKLKNS